MSKKSSCKATAKHVSPKAMNPIRYIDLDELEKKLEEGIPLEEVENLQTAWTASNVPVMDHLRYLMAIDALEVRDKMLILARVPA